MSGRQDEDEADDDRSPVPGVREIDHTADVALEIEAPDLATLFERAGRGTVWLLFGESPDDVETAEVRRVDIAAGDLSSLLRAWLREVVFWHETEGWIARGLEVDGPIDAPVDTPVDTPVDGEPAAGDDGGPGGGDRGEIHLRGTVRGGTTTRDPVREIKGVTRHGLAVERQGGQWFARVIFDV